MNTTDTLVLSSSTVSINVAQNANEELLSSAMVNIEMALNEIASFDDDYSDFDQLSESLLDMASDISTQQVNVLFGGENPIIFIENLFCDSNLSADEVQEELINAFPVTADYIA